MHWHITGSFTRLIAELIFFLKGNTCLLDIASGSKRLRGDW